MARSASIKPRGDEDLWARVAVAVKSIDDRLLRRIAMAVGMFVVIFALIAVDFSPKKISGLEVSKPSPVTVRAPRNITLLDMERTQALRRRAAENVPRIHRFEVDAPAKARAGIASVYQRLEQIVVLDAGDSAKNAAEVKKLLPFATGADVDWLIGLDEPEIGRLQNKTIELAATIMTDKISIDGLAAQREKVKRQAMAIEDQRAAKIVGQIAADNVRVNSYMDKAKTNNAIAAAVDKVKPVMAGKQKGETIVTEGGIVTPLQEHFLKELGLADSFSGKTGSQVLGEALIVVALMVLASIYLREFQPKVYRDDRMLVLVFVILTIVSLLAKGLAPLFPPYLIPVGGAAMLTTILVRPRAGIMMAITAGIITGIFVNSPQYWIYAFMTGLAAVYLTAHISHRSDLTRAGLWLMLASGVIALAAGLMKGEVGSELLVNAGWGVVGGFAAIILTIGTLQFLELAFNITTDMKLLELSNPTQPLLRELMVNAPGTYNHSIITGNLVESVAQKVGANPLLARTGAYYHDIGKIRRPFFFVENQYGDNPHDKTQPNLSYLIITAHVKEGVEIARKHRLPQELVDIISQHHGTSLMSYFYSRAKEQDDNTTVAEHHYRYAGDKPKSKEAALIMLADAAEAAARALQKPTHNRLEQMVKKIVKERLRDGQLDESALTLADLETVTRGYTQTLTTMYHSRIEYPEIEVPIKPERRVVVERLSQKSVGRPDRAIGS